MNLAYVTLGTSFFSTTKKHLDRRRKSGPVVVTVARRSVKLGSASATLVGSTLLLLI